MGPSTQINSQSIDELLARLRVAGEHPPPELLDAIRGLGLDAVPALIALISSPVEYDVVDPDPENRTGWAPYSAVTILGELHPPEALQPLLALLPWEDYDYLSTPLLDALARFGEVALDPLTEVLGNRHRSVWTRWRAAEAMEKMAAFYPGLRGEVISRLVTQLDRDEPRFDDLDTLRGALVSALLELHATEAIPSIVRAFAEGPIDESIVSWPEVRRELEIGPDIAPHLDKRERHSFLHELFSEPWSDQIGMDLAPQGVGGRGGTPLHRDGPKIGRNDPCPCGSGNKYKRCHGR